MTMPIYNLIDHIGWLTTRRIPLRSDAVTHVMTLINNTYTNFIQRFAGINTQNSTQYWQSLMDITYNESFASEAIVIILPYSLLDFIEVEYLVNNVPFTSDMITQLFNCIEMTPEFSSFLTSLSTMTPVNCTDWEYKQIIQFGLMALPKFVRDAQTFMLPV